MYPDPNTLKTLSDSLPSSTKELLFNPAADAIGRGIGGILYWVFQKPIKLGIIKQHEFEDLANKLAKGFEAIPEINRDDSKMGLAIKTLENSKYSLDSEILRKMFANLLAGTVDNRVNGKISPLFPTILGNMSTENAAFIQNFERSDLFPAANIDRFRDDTHATIVPGVIGWNFNEVGKLESEQKSIDFFGSFGILESEIDGIATLVDSNALMWYKAMEKPDIVLKYKESAEKQGYGVRITEGHIRLTELGKSFFDVIYSE